MIQMEVFISWSGERSRAIAQELHTLLPDILQDVSAWMSEHDINAGERWSVELNKELESSKFGILCLTPENLTSPWLLFEAGAIAKSVDDSRVVPYALDLKLTSVPYPLAQFQGVEATRDGTLKLVRAMNAITDEPLSEERLRRRFDLYWPSLEATILEVSSKTNQTPNPSGNRADDVPFPLPQDWNLSGEQLRMLLNFIEQKWPDLHQDSPGSKLILDQMHRMQVERNINRAYAIDHFDPTIWAAPRAYYWLALQCRRFLKDNYVGSSPAWDIIFSDEVFAAIERSLQNIGRLPGLLHGGVGASLTHFDDAPPESRPYRPLPGAPRFEVVRILVWEPDSLRQYFVPHLIRMHGAFNVPLFFIDKSWAIEQGVSLDIEYLLLCTSAHKRSFRARHLDGSEWPPNPPEPVPISQTTRLEKPLDHFLTLLECKELLFAADAYKIVGDGRWDEYIRLIRGEPGA